MRRITPGRDLAVASVISSPHIPDHGTGPYVFLEPERAPRSQKYRDVAVRVVQVTELASADRAGLGTRGGHAVARALDAERALLDDAGLLLERHLGVDLGLRDLWVDPVEVAC